MRFLASAMYCLLLDAIIVIGCGYVVFWRGESGWWFALAFFLSGFVGVPEGVQTPSSLKQPNEQ